MNIQLTSVDIDSSGTSSIWNFSIRNVGDNILNLTFDVYIVPPTGGDKHLKNQSLTLPPKGQQNISVLLNSVPPSASLVVINLDFTVVPRSVPPTRISYMQTCQYSANTCQ